MTESKKRLLKTELNKAVKAYVDAFCAQYEMEVEFNVADDILGIYNLSDYFVNLSDIVYCVDNNVSFDDFICWYDYCLWYGEKAYINLHSFLGLTKDLKKQFDSNERVYSELLYMRIKDK